MSELPNSPLSDAPQTRGFAHLPLRVAVETAPGSGDYRFESRLNVSELKLSCDKDMSTATLEAWVGPIFATASHVADPAIGVADVLSGTPRTGGRGFLSPDQRIIVYLDGEEDGRRILFSGYAEVPQYHEKGQVPTSNQGASIVVESVLKRQSKQLQAWVSGRYVRKSSSQDAWRTAYQADTAAKTTPLGTGLDLLLVDRPCTFNARGEANRSPAPLTLQVNGKPQSVYVFTDDDDPDAELWTWAQAFRYLVALHCLRPFDDTSANLVGDTNLFAQTAGYIDKAFSDRPTSPASEGNDYDGDPFTPSNILKFAWLAIPSDAVMEGMNVRDALTAACDCTSTHVTLQTSGDSAPSETLVFWASGAGRRTTVSKNPPDASEALPPGEILARLNTDEFTISADYSFIVNHVVGLGDVRRYEITTQLVPAWAPETGCDNIAADDTTGQDAAIAAAHAHETLADPRTDDWFKKYHTAGSEFGAHADVARRWGLNETGRYLADVFGRSSGPFAAAAYAPWEPSNCSLRDWLPGEDGEYAWAAVASGSWSRIPRPFQPCFSAVQKRSLGVVAEASFDGGTKWERLECNILVTEAGLYIHKDDTAQLWSIYDTGHELGWWAAIVKGLARVRVTAVIEGDDRLAAEFSSEQVAGYHCPISHQSSRFFNWSQRLKCNRRDAGNSIFGPAIDGVTGSGTNPAPDQVLDCRDDIAVIMAWSETVLDLLTARTVPASVAIPWLEFTRYRVGDCITEFEGQGLRLEGSASGSVRRPPDIVALRYSGTRTQIVLCDPNMAEVGADLAKMEVG